MCFVGLQNFIDIGSPCWVYQIRRLDDGYRWIITGDGLLSEKQTQQGKNETNTFSHEAAVSLISKNKR